MKDNSSDHLRTFFRIFLSTDYILSILKYQCDVKVEVVHTTSKRFHLYTTGIVKLSNMFKYAGYVMGLLRLLRYF